MPSLHSVLKSPVTTGVWGGTLTFTTAGGSAGDTVAVTITDPNFTSQIVRASNHIIMSPANSTARALVWVTGGGMGFIPIAEMTNNASIIVTYSDPNGIAEVNKFHFLIFAGGTNT